MRVIADLHIHSGYSRATSREMNLKSLARWARIKGIDILGTGDFTHPEYFASIEEELVEAGRGLFVLKEDEGDDTAPRFMLSAEVSNIYKHDGKTRKIHNLIYTPTLEAARKMISAFDRLGNIKSDGRPIFGFSAYDLLQIVLDSGPDSVLVPAHAWTPWFSIFGSRSGYDSIEECFGDLSDNIFAIETGLSSNPAMNRRVSALDDITLISNSDAHSPAKLGREANVLDSGLDYFEVMDIIRAGDPEKFLFTVEFFPEEGKYHADGHRECGVVFSPKETLAAGGICPVCGGKLTVGVLSRVEELADRPEGSGPERSVPARHVVPLMEIIAEIIGVGVNSVKVKREYTRLTTEAGTEFGILLDMDSGELKKAGGEALANAITRMRAEEVSLRPGFDGEFGRVSVTEKVEEIRPTGPMQAGLF